MADVLLNLVVIRAADPERSVKFYESLGLSFEKHQHGSGPEHLTCNAGPVTFEIYPQKHDKDLTSSCRLGFRVASVDVAVSRLQEIGVEVISPPKDSPWGRRAVVDDFDGHRVELTEEAINS